MDEGLMKTYNRAEEVFVAGHGAVLQDSTGREYLDFLAGIAVSALGHGHAALTAALRNVTDEVYGVAAYTTQQWILGQPRTAELTARYRFR